MIDGAHIAVAPHDGLQIRDGEGAYVRIVDDAAVVVEQEGGIEDGKVNEENERQNGPQASNDRMIPCGGASF
jgi:hypothetical protein